jgi:hypothetical protein
MNPEMQLTVGPVGPRGQNLAGLCARKWPDCIFLHLLIQSFWVNVTCQANISVKKNLLFEAEIYVPGYAQNAGFCTIYP